MEKYLLVYRGGGGMEAAPEARQAIMAQWEKWFASLGPAVVDDGNPVMKTQMVGANGAVPAGGGMPPVSGYSVLQADSLDAALLAIRSIHRGNSYFSSDVSAAMALDELMIQARQPEPKVGHGLLSARERQVLQLITEGAGNQRIADTLVISVKTVEAHKAHIMTKLNATNRYGIKQGLVSLDLPPLTPTIEAA